MDILKARKKAKKLKENKENQTEKNENIAKGPYEGPPKDEKPTDETEEVLKAEKPDPDSDELTMKDDMQILSEEDEYRKEILKQLEMEASSHTIEDQVPCIDTENHVDTTAEIDESTEIEIREKILKDLEEQEKAGYEDMHCDMSIQKDEIKNKNPEKITKPVQSGTEMPCPSQKNTEEGIKTDLSIETDVPFDFTAEHDGTVTKTKAHKKETPTIKVLVFRIGRELYSIDIMKIKKIDPIDEITRVPNTPDFVRGIISLRGEIIPILDLKIKLKIKDTQTHKKPGVIILNEQNAGILIDFVVGVKEIEKGMIETATTIVGSIDSEFITGIVRLKDLVFSILDITRLIKKEIIEEIDKYFVSLKYY